MRPVPAKRRLQDRLNACTAKLQDYRRGMPEEPIGAVLALLRTAGRGIDAPDDRQGAHLALCEAESLLAAWRPEGAA